MALDVRAGAVGPGVQLARLLGERGEIVATLVVGDNWAHADHPRAVDAIVDAIASARADAVILGPAFASGRYGITCGRVGAAVVERLGLRAVVTGMHPENPGAYMFRRQVLIAQTAPTSLGMGAALTAMARLCLKLAAGERLGAPAAEGYIPRGLRRNVFVDRPASERAIVTLLDKVAGRPFATEIELPRFTSAAPPPALADVKHATIAVVTSGGVVPKGNPDRIESRHASRWGRYSLAGCTSADADRWECVHGGFDNHFLNEDPNRVLPLDVLREMEGHEFGRLYPDVISTVGNMMEMAPAERFGREIAGGLAQDGVDGVIFAVT
jgi:glycine reductase